MHLEKIEIKNHPILTNLGISFLNERTHAPYSVVIFVGENGCGKTTLLNELFNYSNSQYVINKRMSMSITDKSGFHSIFIRQDTKYSEAMNELTARISGRPDPFPTKTKEESNKNQNTLGCKSSNGINNPIQAKEILSLFSDSAILEAYESKKIGGIKCGGDVLTSIDGSKSSIDLTQLSSGQQEILLKIKSLENISSDIDYILFDEPEISLHPRWQKIIINFVKDMIKDSSGNSPQLFIATHSEKVMESLIGKEDVLIVRLSKDNGEIKSETINEMDLCLPRVTFAELDYVVFGISTYDYHNELYAYFIDLLDIDSPLKIDKKIRNNSLYSSEYFKPWIFVKMFEQSNGILKKREYKYVTLLSYIRNYFHHPKEGKEPSIEELTKSIDFLRKLIKANS